MIKKEGDLYKIVNVHGRDFPLYYGYYDQRDKESKYNDPIPIYPNFKLFPIYTNEGFPYATEMQDACIYYEGNPSEESCFYCKHFKRGEELIGLCVCINNKKEINL